VETVFLLLDSDLGQYLSVLPEKEEILKLEKPSKSQLKML